MSFTVLTCSKCQHHTRVPEGRTVSTCYNCGEPLFAPDSRTKQAASTLDEVRAKAYAFDSLLMHFASTSMGISLSGEPIKEDQKAIAAVMLDLFKEALADGRQRVTPQPSQEKS